MPRCALLANRVGLCAVVGSLWFQGRARRPTAALGRDLAVDVAVLGGGIVGLTTALLLEHQGASVALLESSIGEDAARTYGDANEAGIDRVFALAAELGIDCDLKRKPNYTYTVDASELDEVREEAELARRLGLPASYVDDVDLPFPVAGAVRFEDQAEFHPVKYLEGLAAALGGS